MSARIRDAYLKGHTWLYRRNYPKDVALALSQRALKQSLKTGEPVPPACEQRSCPPRFAVGGGLHTISGSNQTVRDPRRFNASL